MGSWNALQYLSANDLSEIDQQFAVMLKEDKCMVFWTGISRSLAQQWACERGLKTLAIAMGPLMDPMSPISPQNRMHQRKWSKYMKGASGRYAQHACRNRRAIVVTNPPPNIYSTRERSMYRHLEEPILKGAFGGKKVVSISYVHPGVCEAVDFSYQVWPLDQSFRWTAFVQHITMTISNVTSMLVTSKVHEPSTVSVTHQSGTKTLEAYLSAGSQLEPKAANQNQKDALQWEVLLQKEAKKEAKQQRVLAQEQAAQQQKKARKEAKRQRVLLEQQLAQQQKEARKEAKRQRVLLEQQLAQQQKEARKEAKRQRVLLEQHAAQRKKEARKEAKRQQVLAVEEAARQKKEAKKKAKRQLVLAVEQAAWQQKEAK